MSMNSCGMGCLDYQKLGVGSRLQLMTKCISRDYCFHFGRKAAGLVRAHADGQGEPTREEKSSCWGRRQDCSAGSRSYQSVVSAPPTSLSDHCDNGHTLHRNLSTGFETVQPETLIFKLCTK